MAHSVHAAHPQASLLQSFLAPWSTSGNALNPSLLGMTVRRVTGRPPTSILDSDCTTESLVEGYSSS
ncbi:hypothetical protein ARMSODRAFT_957186 [Armillaria solidipes]|uniref:Uncharacterized protein n=1 Tax=Armillaria solidipes TaxID=1076256 RepID=A0A2H3BY44_9AGAR|nr:hypothetical protein ARMSODRAFT_957186 [Armillaria solidipes]